MLLFLAKLIIQPFYKRNGGFFLFFFFLLFGTVQPHSLLPFHHALIQSILHSSAVTVGVFLLWLFYNNKGIGFISRILNSNEGSFLHVLGTLSAKQQWGLLLAVQLSLYAPVLVYSVVVGLVAFKEGELIYIPLLAGFHTLVCAGSVQLHYNRINNRGSIKPIFQLPIRKKGATHYWLYGLLFFTKKEKGSLAVVKLYSFLVFYIMLVYNALPVTSSDFIMPFLTILWAQALLPFRLVQFAEKDLLFFRNLPRACFRMGMLYLFTYAVLLLPELVFLVLVQPFSALPGCIIFYTLTAVTLALFTSIQYNEQMDRTEYIKVIFLFSFVSIFFLLNHNYAFLSGIEAAVSVLL